MSNEYTNGDAQVQQPMQWKRLTVVVNLGLDKCIEKDASVPEWQKKDNRPHRKLNHKEMARRDSSKGL